MNSKTAALYIVSTPIGNLTDISERALATLRLVDMIAAEDTRHSKRLLDHFAIATPMIALHEFNERQQVERVLGLLEEGKNVALICDAGTPLISDPGFRVVRAAHQANYTVVPIPGPCAAITALSVSGLPTDHFVFEGFLPAKGEVRKKRLQQLVKEARTIIFYESVHRIVNLIDLLRDVFGDERIATVARELTKQYETVHQDTLAALHAWIVKDKNQQKGEFVVVVHGAEKVETDASMLEYQRILRILMEELPLKQAVGLAVKLTGARKSLLYDMALQLK